MGDGAGRSDEVLWTRFDLLKERVEVILCHFITQFLIDKKGEQRKNTFLIRNKKQFFD